MAVIGGVLWWRTYRQGGEYTTTRVGRIIFFFLFTTFATLFTVFVGWHQVLGYFEARSMYAEGQYKVAEGVVEDFVPMPVSGHANEKFCVDGIKFSYSDFDESYYGFNNAASHGGPIQENGMQVRIAYITEGKKNIILRIEAR